MHVLKLKGGKLEVINRSVLGGLNLALSSGLDKSNYSAGYSSV